MSVFGHPKIGNPKDVTQQDQTSPHGTRLIGRCKDMMSRMDPMRAWEWQDEVAGTSLVTRKFSSSIFCWKGLHKLQECESKNTKDKPWPLHFGASGKGLSPTFYSYKGAYWRRTRDSTVHAFTNAFMKVFMERFTCAVKDAIILQALNKSRTSRFLFLKLFREQSVWRIQLYHFFGILPKKEVFSSTGSDQSCK